MKEKYQHLFENAITAIYILDPKTLRIIDANEQAINLSGYSKKELLKMKSSDLADENNIDNIRHFFEKYKKEKSIRFDHIHKKKDGSLYPVEINSNIVKYDGKKVYQSFVQDLTERNKADRDIVNALIEGQEKERKRISQELHDGMGQLLSGLKLNLEVIYTKNSKFKNEIQHAITIANDIIKEYKSISHNLVPPALKGKGLKKALLDMCEQINVSERVHINFIEKGTYKRLPLNIEIELFRISQELVNNALTHSESSQITINFSNENENLILIITDNGKGFLKSNTKYLTGTGLKSIKARAKIINSKLSIESQLGKGTKTTLSIKTKY